MAKFKLNNWYGVNKSESRRGNKLFLEDIQNFDTNIEIGELLSRKGYSKIVNVVTPNLDVAFNYQDQSWNKDVLITYNKDAITSNRKLWVYTRDFETSGNYIKQGEYDYGSVELGSRLSFLAHSNAVRIGTGNGENNKALFAGYIDRTGNNGMFNSAAFDQADFYVLKQQWVQQASLFSFGSKVIYDSARNVYYMLTLRGLEIRDENFYLIRVLDDCVLYKNSVSGTNNFKGGIALTGSSLYACGRVPDSADTILVYYDISQDYELTNTVSKTGANQCHQVTTDGNYVWLIWEDGTNGYITEYTPSLQSPANRYTGNRSLLGAANDGTYVFTHDTSTKTLIRMLIASPYTVTTKVHSTTINMAGDIDANGGYLYFPIDSTLYKIDISTFTTATISTSYVISNAYITSVYFNNNLPAITTDWSYVEYLASDPFGPYDWATTSYFPGKLFLNIATNVETGTNPDFTYFYGVCLEDIYGQLSHLMNGISFPTRSTRLPVYLILYLWAKSESYSELSSSSPSLDPAQNVSVWGMYRRIKKIHIFRAYSSSPDAQNPETNYRYHSTIDIDDEKWVVNNPSGSDYDYAHYYFEDSILESNMSSVTFEEFSGLPELFKPYYTNWQSAVKNKDRFYYGNMYTDNSYPNQIIQSAQNAPDMNYQLSTNIVSFNAKDGDEIQNLASLYNRLIIVKKKNSAVYYGLNQETIYNIGTSSPNSIIVHNNIIYLAYNNGFYAFTTDGYKRISKPIDPILEGLTSLQMAAISGVYWEKKQKIWWLAQTGSNSYLYNLNTGTWDLYDIDTSDQHQFILKQYDGKILSCAQPSSGWVYLQDSSITDDGTNISSSFQTKEIEFGKAFYDHEFEEIILTYTSATGFTLTFYYRNENGLQSTQLSFPASVTMNSVRKFIKGFGQSGYFSFSGSFSFQVAIKSIGISTIQGAEIGV